ncbi:hypothetical protein PSPO01_13027 [Paraphaeosphaeria sporulosa]
MYVLRKAHAPQRPHDHLCIAYASNLSRRNARLPTVTACTSASDSNSILPDPTQLYHPIYTPENVSATLASATTCPFRFKSSNHAAHGGIARRYFIRPVFRYRTGSYNTSCVWRARNYWLWRGGGEQQRLCGSRAVHAK